jgi:putative tricarboxylic transport membrane protein
MTERTKDTALSVTVFGIAALWTAFVVATIPPGMGNGDIGPRAFPLAFGVILLALTAILFLKSWSGEAEPEGEPVSDGEKTEPDSQIHWMPAFVLLGEMLLYGLLLSKIGFLLATPIVLIIVMTVNFRVRSWRHLVGMALGLTVGCWVIFGKILGIYLATGTWINLG